MKIPCTSKTRLQYIPTTAFLLTVCSISTVGFVPDPGMYRTPREAVEYVAWKALKEGRPPCVTINPIGISLFCVMGHCTHNSNGKPYCKCNETFIGLTCSVYVGKCATPGVCTPHLCQDDSTKESGFKCVCNGGYYVPDDPKASFCVKNGKTEDSFENDAVSMAIPIQVANTGAVQHTDLSVEGQHTAQTEFPSLRELTTLAWKKDNFSGVGVLCASSDFLICFIEPKEEDETIDALFKKTLEEVVKRKKASHEQKKPVADMHKELYADADDREGRNTKQLLSSGTSKHAAPSRSSRRDTFRNRKHGTVIMQRRAVSTFQTLEEGISGKILSSIDSSQNTNVAGEHGNSEDEVKAQEDNFSNIIPNEGNHPASPRISHGNSNELNSPSGGDKATLRHADLLNSSSLKPPKDDSERIKSIHSLENQPHPAAYSAGSETRKAVQKSHHEDPKPALETADEILDDLKNTVQASEHDKPNVTNTSDVSDVSVKLSNVVQARDEDNLKSSDDSLNVREKVSDDMHGEELQAPEGEGDIVKSPSSIMTLPDKQYKLRHLGEPNTGQSRPLEMPEHSPSDTNEQYVRNKTATSKDANTSAKEIPSPFVTYDLSHAGRLLNLTTLHTDYDGSGAPRSYHLEEEIPSYVHMITRTTNAQRSQADDDHKSLSSEVATHNSKKERDSYVSLRRGNRTFALHITQHEGEQRMHVIHPAPHLLFNVTVLSKQRNSTSWHVVPATGTNGILISWDVYNPEAG